MSRVLPAIDPDLRDAISFAVGFTILGYVIMIMGAFGLYTKLYLIILAILPFVFTISELPAQIRRFHVRTARWSSEFPKKFDMALWLLLLGIIILDLINSGNAAVAWDAAVHHYAFPKALINAGGLVDVPEIPFSYYPGQGEMLYTLGLAVDGEFLAGALSTMWLVPLILAFLSIGRYLELPRAGLWAALIFLGAPLLSDVPFSGLIDLQYFTCCLLAIALLLDRGDDLEWNRIIFMGILMGCASTYKHLGLLFMVAFVPIVLWRITSENKSPGMGLLGTLAVIFITFVIPLPWYIRSWTATGNPVYPFLGTLFNSTAASQGSFSLESFARTDYPRTLIGFLGYLWHLTMNYWDSRPWFWAISPAWLAFAPVAVVLALSKSRSIEEQPEKIMARLLLVLAFLATLINFYLAPAYPRYLYPSWLCLSILAGWSLVKIRINWPMAGKILIPIVLTFPLIVMVGKNIKMATEVLPQYFNKDARELAVLREYPSYDTLMWTNLNADPEKDLILTTDPKVYYLDNPAIIATPQKESSKILPWDSKPEEILENWRELGVTHFILDTDLISVKHGFGIALFSSILGDRDAVWLDIVTTHDAAVKYGIDNILSDDEFLYMGQLGGLVIVDDGVRSGRYLFTRENADMFQSWGRDWQMAKTILKFENAGILKSEHKTYSGDGPDSHVVSTVYSVHLPPDGNIPLPDLPDVTGYGLDYEDGPVDLLPGN